ncbi:MAG: Mth938-like domain-containing protein [Desulfovibrionaceae bacterium]
MIFRKKDQPTRHSSSPSGGESQPHIEHYSFGNMVIDGSAYRDDVKIVDGRVSSSWRRRSGHLAEAGDAADLLQAQPEVLVLGTGASGRMRVDASLESQARDRRIELVVQPTSQAAQTYNELAAKGRRVAAGFHLTC